jgi:hypothetical protein
MLFSCTPEHFKRDLCCAPAVCCRLLLQMLHDYDSNKGKRAGKGSWGEARAAAHPLLVHACFCFDRTGHGRMQALLPLLASSPRLLLPPGLLTGVPATTTTAAAAAGAVGNGTAGNSSSSSGHGGAGHAEGAHVPPAAAAAAAVISSELLASGGAASPQKAEQVSAFVSCVVAARFATFRTCAEHLCSSY